MSITFGRFSDSFKPKHKQDTWNKCEKLFYDKAYSDSYEAFFNYLSDDEIQNVKFTRSGDDFRFEFPQGSKFINGFVKDGRIEAEAGIVEFEKPSVAVMRRLMEMNYSLFYSRFAFKDNSVVIRFDSSVAGGPPRKLYYALKELATRADKQDDILKKDFSQLKVIGSTSVEELPAGEKEIKYRYFRKFITDMLESINALNEEQFSGAISYLLLNTAYKIDYLIVPEGMLMNDLEKISFDYFAKDNKQFQEKNKVMKEALKKLLDMPKDDVLNALFKTRSTFGIANPGPHQAVLDLFNNNINNIKWYVDNGYPGIAVTMYEYLATFSLFSYGLPKPDAKLFHLMINIINQDYFIELGIPEQYYKVSENKFDEELIKKNIDAVISNGLELYPLLKFNTANLKFDSLLSFLKTFTAEIQQLNYNS